MDMMRAGVYPKKINEEWAESAVYQLHAEPNGEKEEQVEDDVLS